MRQDDPGFDLGRARVCAILNGGSGKKDAEKIAALLEQEIGPRAANLEIRRSRRGPDLPGLARQAVSDGFDLLLAVGGDGTQSAVADAVAGSDVIMGVVPGGTFNYFARDLGVGETPDKAIQTLLNARIRAVHVGQVNEMVFLNNVSFGAYPEILERRETIYRRWGRSRAAAYWSVVAALWNLRRPMSLTAHAKGQDQQFETALAFVASSAYQLETFGLDGAEAIRNGHFALMIARAKKPLPLIAAALRLAFGKTAKDSDFDLIVADHITINTRPNHQLVAHDGEKSRMTGPFELTMLHDGLRVLVPRVAKDDAAA